jgi:signal transduction histidine kinase
MWISDLSRGVPGTMLKLFVAGELIAWAASTLISLALHTWVLRSPWLIGLALICLAVTAVQGAALRLALQHRNQQSVTVMCIGNWAGALMVTFVAPMFLPVVALAALLPVIFAERYVRGKQLLTFTATTACCLLALGALAGLQDISGLSEKLPKSVGTTFVIAGLPAMAILILLVAWNNAAALRNTAKELAASRARLIAATDNERRRLERDLHDGAQQHLVALAVLLQLARTAEQDRSESLLLEASQVLETAIAEIRRLAHGIYPPLLVSGGLAQALPAAAGHAAIPVNLDLDGLGRYPTEIEAALYYCTTEALQNAAKHGGADTKATISAHADDRELTLTISDTGSGFNQGATGTGLTNMKDRLAAIGGQLEVDTAPGRGTRIIATVANRT